MYYPETEINRHNTLTTFVQITIQQEQPSNVLNFTNCETIIYIGGVWKKVRAMSLKSEKDPCKRSSSSSQTVRIGNACVAVL